MALDIDTNWEGLLSFASLPPRADWKHPHSVMDHSDRLKFTGTNNYPEAIDLLRFGWPEDRDRIVGELQAIAPVTARHTVKRLDVAGAYPIAAMAAAGDMECMVHMGGEIAPRPVVRLAVAVNFLSDVENQNIINRGVAICRVIDALEDAGTRVELVAAWSARADFETFKAAVIVKEARDPLELDRIAFVFAHPSMNRRIGFRLREITKAPANWAVGYGATANMSAEDFPDAVIIQAITPHNESRYSTPAKAFDEVSRVFAIAGVEITSHA